MRQVKKGSTNVSVDLYIIDATDGTPELGVVFNEAGIDLEYRRQDNFVVNITEADLATPDLEDVHLDGGFLEIGHGYYRFDVPDAAFATGVETVSIQGTITGMIVLPQTIQLVDFDPEDGVRLGLTALPDAAADAIGGLPISDAGGLDLDAKLANTNEVTAVRMAALTDWIDGGRLDLLLDLIKVVTDAQAATGTGLTAIPWNSAWDTEVESEVNDALVALGLDHLVGVAVVGADVIDNSIMAKLVSSAATADWDTFVNTAEALQALRDNLALEASLTTHDTDVKALLPAALVGGRMDSSVGAMATNVLTAAAINANAITAAKIASAAITNAKFAAGAIDAAAIANNAIAEAKIATGAIIAAKFGAGAIDAAALNADAVDKIRDGLLPTQNVAFDNIPILFVAASDHVTPVTGASGTSVTRSIDGGAFGSGTGTLSEVGNGSYAYDASAADMNGGIIQFRFVATGGTPGAPDDVFLTIVTGGGV